MITTTHYLTRWDEAQLVRDCNTETAAKFIFEYILSRFECPSIFLSVQGSNLLNKTIEALIEEFQFYHKKSTPCHPQENGTAEASNNIL